MEGLAREWGGERKRGRGGEREKGGKDSYRGREESEEGEGLVFEILAFPLLCTLINPPL